MDLLLLGTVERSGGRDISAGKEKSLQRMMRRGLSPVSSHMIPPRSPIRSFTLGGLTASMLGRRLTKA